MQAGDLGSILVRKVPWKRKWQPTLVFLPGKASGQGSLTGYSSWGYKESNTTEHVTIATTATTTCQANLGALGNRLLKE